MKKTGHLQEDEFEDERIYRKKKRQKEFRKRFKQRRKAMQ